MSDLISRDDAIKAFEEEKRKAKEIRDDFAKFPDSVFEQSIYNEAVKAWRTAINIVKKLPTKYKPHGVWKIAYLHHEYMGCAPMAYYCSECHHITTFRTFYCPNCGADMRGDTDE